MFRHDFDLMFALRSEHEDPDDIPPEELRRAALARINSLQPDELREAFGHVETNEED